MKVRLGLLVAAVTMLVLVLGGGTSALSASGGCAGNGTASSSPGFMATGPAVTAALTVKAKVTCQGTTSGQITATGSLRGTCNSLTGTLTVSGALNGTVKVTTHAAGFQLTGKLNNHAFNGAGVFAPKKGDCITKPLTSANVVFGGAFAK